MGNLTKITLRIRLAEAEGLLDAITRLTVNP